MMLPVSDQSPKWNLTPKFPQSQKMQLSEICGSHNGEDVFYMINTSACNCCTEFTTPMHKNSATARQTCHKEIWDTTGVICEKSIIHH